MYIIFLLLYTLQYVLTTKSLLFICHHTVDPFYQFHLTPAPSSLLYKKLVYKQNQNTRINQTKTPMSYEEQSNELML